MGVRRNIAVGIYQFCLLATLAEGHNVSPISEPGLFCSGTLDMRSQSTSLAGTPEEHSGQHCDPLKKAYPTRLGISGQSRVTGDEPPIFGAAVDCQRPAKTHAAAAAADPRKFFTFGDLNLGIVSAASG